MGVSWQDALFNKGEWNSVYHAITGTPNTDALTNPGKTEGYEAGRLAVEKTTGKKQPDKPPNAGTVPPGWDALGGITGANNGGKPDPNGPGGAIGGLGALLESLAALLNPENLFPLLNELIIAGVIIGGITIIVKTEDLFE